MKKGFLVALFLFSSKVSAVVPLQTLAQSSLRFIAKEQIGSDGRLYKNGEWPTWVESSLIPASVGVGRFIGSEPEPSAFTTASVANQLAVIYQQYPEYRQIPSLILKAQGSFERYREGSLYNFYPPKMWRGVRVHQAAAMSLLPMWKGFTNIPQDADTSSSVHASRIYAGWLQGQPYKIPSSTLRSLARFRDLNRRSHFYNRMYGDKVTGSFMTWQFDENDPDMPRYYFAEPEYGVRIPFNRNDIDCIVNLNVLRMLALGNNSDLPGRNQTCQWLNRISARSRYAVCGIYYPNTYNFAHSAALVDGAGEKCLRPQAQNMVKHIMRTRLRDGAWANNQNARPDRVQSTAFAMLALAHFGDFRDQNIRIAMRTGANFLYRHKSRTKDGDYYWRGEVFFTDTAIARSLVNWRSHSFTTATALHALLEAHRKTGWQPTKALVH